jgi:prepilin peptidase CpaA
MTASMVAWWLAALLGLAASVEGLRTQRIPEWLTAGGSVAGVVCAASTGWLGLGIAVAGAAIGFGLMQPLYRMSVISAGEAKLMAAFGVLLGPGGVLAAAAFGSMAAAIWVLGAHLRGVRALPFAPALVAGVWVSLVGGG